ncbi:single-stranded DNA-binding protein [Rhodocytophaga aerolata]|uniref:Single-stranded DNA-binding protein n=1 Tax=Rhodocytophaga aerolata TaxID=455078 RepID=A0ABT8R3Y8_9BACT|nr:single-stranded DNA-binding protein [Rhodocytophaga aerolata]MDO1446812.1 single-stranded DNA-binding protein [Rhodocytophaga aerolata]
MAGVNKVILVGHLGKDPEIRVIGNDRKVAKFTLATTETYKDNSGQRVESTEWHNVEFWGPIADVIERFLKKGSQVFVEGRIRTRSYDDKDGIKRYVTEIVGQNMTMLGGKPSGGGGANESPAEYNESTFTPTKANNSYGAKPASRDTPPPFAQADPGEDDLPF